MVTTHAPWLKRLPSILYKLGAQAWIDQTFPRHLFIETTAACNLACSYCPRERRGNHMAWDLFTGIVAEASQYGPRSFSLHLFGEPLLYPRCADACAYIKQCNRHHTILLTTNGTHLEQHCEWIITSGIDQILWTWRPEATFTLETKSKLRKWGKFRVRFIQEITPQEAYAEWANWPNVEGRRLHNYGGNINTSIFSGNGWSSAAVVDTKATSVIQSRWPCYHLWLAPAVAWNGDILLCCADPHHKEVLGHFPEQSVHEVWTGKQLNAVRQSHLRGDYKGICTNCDVWKSYPDLFFSWQKRQ